MMQQKTFQLHKVLDINTITSVAVQKSNNRKPQRDGQAELTWVLIRSQY